MRASRQGFLLISILFFLTGVLSLITVGFTRSMVTLTDAQRTAARQQAFTLAEAGMDDELTASHTADQLPQRTSRTVNLPGSSYTLSYTPSGAALVTVSSQGQVAMPGGGLMNRTVRVLLELPSGAPRKAFDYTVATDTIRLSGSATMGDGAPDGSGRVPLYQDAEQPCVG